MYQNYRESAEAVHLWIWFTMENEKSHNISPGSAQDWENDYRIQYELHYYVERQWIELGFISISTFEFVVFAYYDKCELCRVSSTNIASACVNQSKRECGEHQSARNKGIPSCSNNVVEWTGERVNWNKNHAWILQFKTHLWPSALPFVEMWMFMSGLDTFVSTYYRCSEYLQISLSYYRSSK